MALRILSSEISRAPHSGPGSAERALQNLRESAIAAHRDGACNGPGSNHRPAARITGVSLYALPEQILFPEAAPARRQERSRGLRLRKVSRTKQVPDSSQSTKYEVLNGWYCTPVPFAVCFPSAVPTNLLPRPGNKWTRTSAYWLPIGRAL